MPRYNQDNEINASNCGKTTKDYHSGNAQTGWGMESPIKHQQSREITSLGYQNHTQRTPQARYRRRGEGQGYQLNSQELRHSLALLKELRYSLDLSKELRYSLALQGA